MHCCLLFVHMEQLRTDVVRCLAQDGSQPDWLVLHHQNWCLLTHPCTLRDASTAGSLLMGWGDVYACLPCMYHKILLGYPCQPALGPQKIPLPL